jgi:hypothetical protein
MPQRLKDELGTQEPALPGNALNWIGGEWVDAKQRKKSFDRATGEEIGSYADASRVTVMPYIPSEVTMVVDDALKRWICLGCGCAAMFVGRGEQLRGAQRDG